MENFVFCSPTNFIFGRGTENQVGKLCKENGATRVLIVYGGGSVVRSGLLDRVRTALTDENMPFGELGGVKPNPEDDLVRIGIEMVHAENFDFILPVGGGSTIDATKFMAAGACVDFDPWDFLTRIGVVFDRLEGLEF